MKEDISLESRFKRCIRFGNVDKISIRRGTNAEMGKKNTRPTKKSV